MYSTLVAYRYLSPCHFKESCITAIQNLLDTQKITQADRLPLATTRRRSENFGSANHMKDVQRIYIGLGKEGLKGMI